MKKVNSARLVLAVAVVCTVVACSKSATPPDVSANTKPQSVLEMIPENGANTDELAISAQSTGNTERFGANHFIYTESNEADVNRIIIYQVRPDGTLHYESSVESGGSGTGVGLGSQFALAFDKNHEWLYAVNAGSGTVSSFRVQNDGSLTLAHTAESDGKTPRSVSVHDNLLYVLNAGSDNIHGFRIGKGGELNSIAGSTQALSASLTDAPQISFTPNGDWLVVTEKATNHISSFKVKNNGSTWPGVVTTSTGETPFGFDFARDHVMVVTNAAGGVAGAGSLTSYRTGDNGKPHAINGAVPNSQGAPCWVATTAYGFFAFVSNTGSNSISSYYVGPGGRLYLIDKAAAATDNSPADIVVSKNNYFVYALTAKSGTIGEYRRTLLGGLKNIGTASGLPGSSSGLATY